MCERSPASGVGRGRWRWRAEAWRGLRSEYYTTLFRSGSHGKPGKTAAGELPAHVCARDRPRAASDAGAGDGAPKRGEGSPVALRAPYKPSPRRKPRTRSVTDVLSLAVTHVMAHHILEPPLLRKRWGA